jgi:hypothetical protein
VGLNGFNYKLKLISISIAIINTDFYKPAVKNWNWIIMQKNIIEIKAEQKLPSIVITKATLKIIKAAWKTFAKTPKVTINLRNLKLRLNNYHRQKQRVRLHLVDKSQARHRQNADRNGAYGR